MAKTSSRKQGAPTISEPLKAATKSPSSSRAASWPTGKAPRPLLEAKAPPLKIVPQRGKAATKTAKAVPDAASPSPAAKGRTPAPRRAERRSLSEIQTAPAPAKPLAASRATQAAAKPAPVARPEPSASAGPPASAPAKASVEGALFRRPTSRRSPTTSLRQSSWAERRWPPTWLQGRAARSRPRSPTISARWCGRSAGWLNITWPSPSGRLPRKRR